MKVIYPEKDELSGSIETLDREVEGNADYVKLIESCALAYFHRNPLTRYLFRKRLRVAAALLGTSPAHRLLDAGCGIGYFLPTLTRVADQVHGIDRHGVAVEYARRLVRGRGLANVQVSTGDILNLPYPTASFDVVVSLSTFEHITNLDGGFTELRRICAPGARVVVGYPMEGSFLLGLAERLDHATCLRKHVRCMTRCLEQDEGVRGQVTGHVSTWLAIDAALGRNFRILKRRYVGLLPVVGRLYAMRLAERDA